MSNKFQEVINIATRELRACYTKDGIIAGNHHFTDYWARDGYFASLGSLAIGDKSKIRKMLGLFYRHQSKNGLIPYRIMRGPVTLGKYFGKPTFYTQPRPTYRLRGIGNEVLDGTTLTILFTALLGLNGGKKPKYSGKIKKGLAYLESREINGLLFDGVMSEWNDTALKWGNLLYSNVIYWYMYDCLSEWTKPFNAVWHKKLENKKEDISEKIRNKLWTGKYFADWYDYKRQDYFYPFSNCLAIAWGLTTDKESELILNQCERVKVGFTLETNSPGYPWWRIDLVQHLLGMGDYQNHSLLWWQPATGYLAALTKMQRQKESNRFADLIVDKVYEDKSVYECYERNLNPVKRLVYSSEQPFAWGSGMILWALINYSKLL